MEASTGHVLHDEIQTRIVPFSKNLVHPDQVVTIAVVAPITMMMTTRPSSAAHSRVVVADRIRHQSHYGLDLALDHDVLPRRKSLFQFLHGVSLRVWIDCVGDMVADKNDALSLIDSRFLLSRNISNELILFCSYLATRISLLFRTINNSERPFPDACFHLITIHDRYRFVDTDRYCSVPVS